MAATAEAVAWTVIMMQGETPSMTEQTGGIKINKTMTTITMEEEMIGATNRGVEVDSRIAEVAAEKRKMTGVVEAAGREVDSMETGLVD